MNRRAFLAASSGAVAAGLLAWRWWPEGPAAAAPVTTDAIGDRIQPRFRRGATTTAQAAV